MTNNDVLRRIRYIFDLNDKKMMSLASTKAVSVDRALISDWLKQDDDPAYKRCTDAQLAIFLNGLIDEKRGKKEGVARAPEKSLTNNVIFLKLKIALNLQAEDVLAILLLANFELSKHELSAFFRKATHKHYRKCKDQVLRNFLQGLQIKYAPEAPTPSADKEKPVKKEEISEAKTVKKDATTSVWGKATSK